MKNKNGFTLIELLAVILVLSIVSLIAISAVNNTINHVKKSVPKEMLKHILKQYKVLYPYHLLVVGMNLLVTEYIQLKNYLIKE